MRKADLAYVAGIIDGEGTICIHQDKAKSGKVYLQLRVDVTNTNEWLIQWLKFALGGHTDVSRRAKIGKNWKPSWRWSVSANQASAFLKLIYPYLRLKKPQAELAIKFQEGRKGRGHFLTDSERAINEAQRILMSSLNKKGIKNK